MQDIILSAFSFSIIPMFCMLIGGMVVFWRKPGPQLTSSAQHFAAGVVFAAVAKELLPNVGAAHAPIALVVGFSLGVLLMLTVKEYTHHLEEKKLSISSLPLGLIIAVGIDIFIDGSLIGISFLVGEQGGILITVALAIEILFLGLSTSASLINNNMRALSIFLIIAGLAILIPIGAFLGAFVFSLLPSDIMNTVLAFGVAALLYLVTEELLTEAHEVQENPWITACFFLGFLIILLLES